ncbi:2OG-Fe(II) oxygenase family protein [Brumicola blandensis]|jgi:tetratricopeptide (TPR) repeat protein|uniref:2OG-Fe(II) oxygenase n=1 Tax=Brumicola blandensis TaxID=3075611 RepID=A0AAW8R133_9ALTE|nr:tetratricopeptide repeat protein [Alteromonas sp. W409]MDT0582902.1 putative 2OG-Fe(II) oxygenase [Alteromonas sp. W409]
MSGSQQQFQRILQQITSKIQSNEAEKAISIIEALPTAIKQHPNVQHLQALAFKVLGQLPASLLLFKQLLSQYPNQAEFQNNAGNVYKDLGNTKLALEHYLKALNLKSDYLDAFKNAMLVHIEEADYESARQMLNAYSMVFSKHPVTQKFEADVLLGQKQYESAANLYELIVQQNPSYTVAKLGLAAALRLSERLSEAKMLLLDVLNEQASANAHYQFGLCLFEDGNYEKAEHAFEQAILLKPSYRAAHNQLNEMLWQLNSMTKFGSSYQRVLQTEPDLSQLREDYVDMLINAEHYDLAVEQIEIGLNSTPSQSGLLAAKSMLLANQQNYEEAYELAKQVWTERQSFRDGIEFIKLAIKMEDYQAASKIIDKLKAEYPENQLVQAYHATCLKLTDPNAYQEFIMLSHSIKAFELPVPEGYDCLEMFLSDLKALLSSMHTTNTRPLQQTLRKGTQTPGRLLERGEPLLNKLKWAYESTVSKYISALPDDDQHPFLRRKSKHFKITGSWSVKLDNLGFHVNHVHPDGWISSACYIAVPDNLSESEGCIRFGQSPLELGDKDTPDLSITPQAGQLVLFPSFMWHGTLPYHSEQMRLTAPFDVVPIAEKYND